MPAPSQLLVDRMKAQVRCRATREQLKTVQGLSPERQDQNPVLTVLYVPYSLAKGGGWVEYRPSQNQRTPNPWRRSRRQAPS